MASFKMTDLELSQAQINAAAAMFIALKEDGTIDWDEFKALSGYSNIKIAKANSIRLKAQIKTLLDNKDIPKDTDAAKAGNDDAEENGEPATPAKKKRKTAASPATKAGATPKKPRGGAKGPSKKKEPAVKNKAAEDIAPAEAEAEVKTVNGSAEKEDTEAAMQDEETVKEEPATENAAE